MFLEISQNSQENTCAWVSFLMKLYLKNDYGTGVFLWILWNFLKHFFYRWLLLYRKKRTGNSKIGMMKLLALALYFLARITLTLISSSVITGCFQKLNFQEFNLVIWNFLLPYAFLYVLVSYSKNSLLYIKDIAF